MIDNGFFNDAQMFFSATAAQHGFVVKNQIANQRNPLSDFRSLTCCLLTAVASPNNLALWVQAGFALPYPNRLSRIMPGISYDTHRENNGRAPLSNGSGHHTPKRH